MIRIDTISLRSVSGLFVFSLVAYSYALWTTEIHISARGNHYCTPAQEYYRLLIIAGYIDMVITLVLPSCIIVVVNIRIIYALVNRRDNTTQKGMMLRKATMNGVSII